MSEPKRYDVGMTEETNNRTGFYASFPRVYEAEQGRYVEYADYARLKAEVERLRKAGDNLARACDENGCHDNGDWDDQQDAIKRWLAAKEGKQS